MRAVLAMLLVTVFAALTLAAETGANAPVSPDGSAVKEQSLLQEGSRIEGRIDIPDARASVLIQPAGRQWDYFHEVVLHRGAAIVILGTLAVLALAFFALGRLRIAGGRSGRKITRFSGFERFAHWLTAVSFVLLALTGLTLTFGKLVLLPILAPETFSAMAQASKYVHNFVSFAFMLGLVLIAFLWFRDNIPRPVDLEWLKQGGGFIKSRKTPHAGRFNAGEKAVFWLALLGGLGVVVSGLVLLFPFYWTNIAGMQAAQVVHAIVAVLFIALILGHIYIGTLGMEGAFEAMGTGEVDLNWAREHHDLWLREKLSEEAQSPDVPSAPHPAK